MKGLKVKAYDEKGVLITSASTDKMGDFDFECGSERKPTHIKLVQKGMIYGAKDVGPIEGPIIDLGYWIVLCLLPPKEWHLKGRVVDKMSGDPIQGLTVEAWDSDSPYFDPLGEDITDAAGEFNIWFDELVFERSEPYEQYFGGPWPDVIFWVKNAQGVLIHETELDSNVRGAPHECPPYCLHKGKEYTLEIDYVTAQITKMGPVPIADIEASGRCSYGGVDDRPFGGTTTISGRIWGAKVSKWRLSYAAGFVDSADPRIGQGGADPFTTIAEGTNRVWDGPIAKWNTDDLNETYTVILVVWDDRGNTFSDTQIIFLKNTPIDPAAEISSPTSCGTLDKTVGTNIEIHGTASDDYFRVYILHWAGCGKTELSQSGIAYPPAGNTTPVVNGLLGTWDISGLADGPYVVRLAVHDRTLVNDGVHTHSDYTWNTITIVS